MTTSSGTGAASLGTGYEALRRRCAAYRLDRDVVMVTGPDATPYLQGQCSQDLATLGVGEPTDSLLLEPDGKLTALVRVVRLGEDRYSLDVDGGFGEAVASRLGRFRLRTKVAIEPEAWSCVALRGPQAPAPASFTATAGARVHALPVAWSGVTGLDLLGPGAEDAVPAGTEWCSDAAWLALRVEAGIPQMGRELDRRTIAAEAGLVERAVSLTKGCYTGQELVARLDARGNKVARRLCGIVIGAGPGADGRAHAGVDPEALDGADLALPGQDKAVGHCTSVAWCPGLGGVGALGYVHRSVPIGAAVEIRPQGVSEAPVVAEVRELPLVAG